MVTCAAGNRMYKFMAHPTEALNFTNNLQMNGQRCTMRANNGVGSEDFTNNRFTAVRYDTNYALPLDTFWDYSADSTTLNQHLSLQADRAQTGDGYAFLCCEN